MAYPPLQTMTFSAAALLVLLLPGAAVAVWLPARGGFLSRLADAIGLSISLTALAALAGFYLNFHFTRPVLTGLYGLCALIFLTGLVRNALSRGVWHSLRWKPALPALAGVTGLVGIFLWRLYQARTLALPAWVDSVHHTLVVRLILENGGLPATLQPYIPAEFSYHYGFHVLAALFSGLTGAEPAVALLWFGQMLNTLIALSVYRLGMELWQDARRAALAALLVGFGLHMPAYYLTWGRYTLITGLVLLPLAMAALLRLSRRPRDRSSIISAILLTAGTALSHYTALLLLGFFTAILLVMRLRQPLTDETGQPLHRWPVIRRLVLSALSGVLLAAPWLWRTWQHLGYQAAIGLVSPLDSGQAGYFDYILYLLGPTHNAVWLGVAAVGLLWALLRKPGSLLAWWGLLLALLTLPWGLRLGPWRPDHMAIVLFLPASLLAADLVFSLAARAAALRWRWLARLAQAAILLAAAFGLVWSARQTRQILNPETVFVQPDDVAALEWVRSNTPAGTRFMINTAPWMGKTYRGVDGGYWLLPYTGRQTILPPVMYTYGEPGFVDKVERQAAQTSKLTTCDAAFWALADEFQANYLYIRLGQGSLQPEALAACPNLVTVYRQGGVSIYEMVR